MKISNDYQLLDFGGGRRLERFGPYILDRPAAAGSGAKRAPKRPDWRADARFELAGAANDSGGPARGCWVPQSALPKRWNVNFGALQFGPLQFELRPTEFGHLGIFPEQADNWDWIAREVGPASARPANDLAGQGRRLKVLNLFAYTGGSTLAAARTGAEVVHVDSARGTVAWARRNAALSGLETAPIRWVVEDAARFVRRELTRGNQYDAVILDPPSYGHGPAGEVWKLDRDLPDLLSACAKLTAGRRQFMLLTCHTPGITPAIAGRMLRTAMAGGAAGKIHAEELATLDPFGGRLRCGVAARWTAS